MNAKLSKIEPQPIAVTPAWTEQDVLAVKDQIAKDANESEFKLFLYTATQRGLNPLLKQIYCIHRSGRMTIQTSIDGYRLIANRTGKLAGIKRGVKYDNNGNLTHGWAEVYRKDWTHPAYEEVSFKEYNQGQGNWNKMPETMIKKVAEAAALRMAFPEDLSGLYTQDEMDQADSKVSQAEIDMASTAFKEAQARMKEIVSTMSQLQKEHSLDKEEMQWATGFDSLKGLDLPQLEMALENLHDFITHRNSVVPEAEASQDIPD